MSDYATQRPSDSMPVIAVFHQMEKLCYMCRRVGTVQFLSQDRLFDGY